jgi:hypothetical protein
MIDNTFQLSRIFAKGWTAARALPANDDVEDIRMRAVALNPYTKEPEKSRWSEGFIKALDH